MNQKQEFLQSEEWLQFQSAVGRETISFSSDDFWANGIMHRLPLIGRYLYVPRGPRISTKYQVPSIKYGIAGLIDLAKEKKMRWVRIEPETEALFKNIQEGTDKKVVKAPHDVQPREVLRVDITPNAEVLFSALKPKTRYNIRLAEKRGIRVFRTRDEKYVRIFLDLIRRTADRKEITPHPSSYYEQLFRTLPEEMCHLFVAEYAGSASTGEGSSSMRDGEVLAANLLITFGTTATYLHGGSSDAHRDMMAPYLLQWEQMKFAKEYGCTEYDFGGVQSNIRSSWEGITKFKMGFSPQTETVVFPGAYDIILNLKVYAFYRAAEYLKKKIGRVKNFFH